MKSLEEILAEMHTKLAEELLKRLESGEASSADLRIVKDFLKDNGIDTVPKNSGAVFNLMKGAPMPGKSDDDPVSNTG